jgi:hypothetical protein
LDIFETLDLKKIVCKRARKFNCKNGSKMLFLLYCLVLSLAPGYTFSGLNQKSLANSKIFCLDAAVRKTKFNPIHQIARQLSASQDSNHALRKRKLTSRKRKNSQRPKARKISPYVRRLNLLWP